ncbi:UNVERIFIED_CONTAM: hypothetical protein FKN15_009572 [Acipenser sinensis]
MDVRRPLTVGPLSDSSLATPVRVQDVGCGSSPSALLSVPRFYVRYFWDRPTSAPSVLKQAALIASLEGTDKLGLVGFPPVDSTIAAMFKAPPVERLPKYPS